MAPPLWLRTLTFCMALTGFASGSPLKSVMIDRSVNADNAIDTMQAEPSPIYTTIIKTRHTCPPGITGSHCHGEGQSISSSILLTSSGTTSSVVVKSSLDMASSIKTPAKKPSTRSTHSTKTHGTNSQITKTQSTKALSTTARSTKLRGDKGHSADVIHTTLEFGPMTTISMTSAKSSACEAKAWAKVETYTDVMKHAGTDSLISFSYKTISENTTAFPQSTATPTGVRSTSDTTYGSSMSISCTNAVNSARLSTPTYNAQGTLSFVSVPGSSPLQSNRTAATTAPMAVEASSSTLAVSQNPDDDLMRTTSMATAECKLCNTLKFGPLGTEPPYTTQQAACWTSQTASIRPDTISLGPPSHVDKSCTTSAEPCPWPTHAICTRVMCNECSNANFRRQLLTIPGFPYTDAESAYSSLSTTTAAEPMCIAIWFGLFGAFEYSSTTCNDLTPTAHAMAERGESKGLPVATITPAPAPGRRAVFNVPVLGRQMCMSVWFDVWGNFQFTEAMCEEGTVERSNVCQVPCWYSTTSAGAAVTTVTTSCDQAVPEAFGQWTPPIKYANYSPTVSTGSWTTSTTGYPLVSNANVRGAEVATSRSVGGLDSHLPAATGMPGYNTKNWVEQNNDKAFRDHTISTGHSFDADVTAVSQSQAHAQDLSRGHSASLIPPANSMKDVPRMMTTSIPASASHKPSCRPQYTAGCTYSALPQFEHRSGDRETCICPGITTDVFPEAGLDCNARLCLNQMTSMAYNTITSNTTSSIYTGPVTARHVSTEVLVAYPIWDSSGSSMSYYTVRTNRPSSVVRSTVFATSTRSTITVETTVCPVKCDSDISGGCVLWLWNTMCSCDGLHAGFPASTCYGGYQCPNQIAHVPEGQLATPTHTQVCNLPSSIWAEPTMTYAPSTIGVQAGSGS